MRSVLISTKAFHLLFVSGWRHSAVTVQCSCGSVVEHCVSSAKVVGSIPREHMY